MKTFFLCVGLAVTYLILLVFTAAITATFGSSLPLSVGLSGCVFGYIGGVLVRGTLGD